MKTWSLGLLLLLLFIVVVQFPPETSGRKWLLAAHVVAKMLAMTKLISMLTIFGAYGWCPMCSTPFGGPPFVGRRDVDHGHLTALPKELDHILTYIASNDDQLCVARFVCEIHAQTNRSNFGKIERNVVELLNSMYDLPLPQDSKVTIFKSAASLGIVSTNTDTCQEVYRSCHLDRSDMARAVEAANILNQ